MTIKGACEYMKEERDLYISNGKLKAFNMAIEVLEKQIPKKPFLEGDSYADGEVVYDTWRCPNCDTAYEVESDDYEYCPKCGQRINWEDAE